MPAHIAARAIHNNLYLTAYTLVPPSGRYYYTSCTNATYTPSKLVLMLLLRISANFIITRWSKAVHHPLVTFIFWCICFDLSSQIFALEETNIIDIMFLRIKNIVFKKEEREQVKWYIKFIIAYQNLYLLHSRQRLKLIILIVIRFESRQIYINKPLSSRQ